MLNGGSRSNQIMLHIVMQMVLYRKMHTKVNRKMRKSAQNGKIVPQCGFCHKIWAFQAPKKFGTFVLGTAEGSR